MSETNLKPLRDFLLANLGLCYTASQENDLMRKITDASEGFGYKEVNKFIAWLINQQLSVKQVEKLATYLTIGETYFLRERMAFDYLEYEYLPRLIKERRESNNKCLKVWSAGCSSGEEPYTIAIMLRRLIPDIKDWKITIKATDINPTFMQKARDGVYSKWSFRRIPQSFIDNNFTPVGEKRYRIKAKIKKMVDFSFLNLFDDKFPSKDNNTTEMDVIFCRNVMIYFSNEGVRSVTTKFYNSLASSGVFLVSPVEASTISHTEFNLKSYQGFTVFNKGVKPHQVYDDWYAEAQQNTQRSTSYNSEQSKSTHQIERSRDDLAERLSKVNRLMTASSSTEKTIPVYEEALALYKSDQLVCAEKYIEKCFSETDVVDCDLSLLLARIKANNGDLHAAEELCLKALSGDKINVAAYYFLAIVLNEQGRVKEATRSAENALFLDAEFILGHYILGSIKMNLVPGWEKHYVNAKRLLEKQKTSTVLDDADGVTVGSLLDIIQATGI